VRPRVRECLQGDNVGVLGRLAGAERRHLRFRDTSEHAAEVVLEDASDAVGVCGSVEQVGAGAEREVGGGVSESVRWRRAERAAQLIVQDLPVSFVVGCVRLRGGGRRESESRRMSVFLDHGGRRSGE
jgi:hypothetical protein